jgi:hypothetical protein
MAKDPTCKIRRPFYEENIQNDSPRLGPSKPRARRVPKGKRPSLRFLYLNGNLRKRLSQMCASRETQHLTCSNEAREWGRNFGNVYIYGEFV